MRSCPSRSITPDEGRSYPDSTFSSVVFPHPDGPTTATNSPRAISRDRSRSTSTAPNECETCSSRNGLSLITPPDTGDLGQAHQHAIDGDTDGADHDHLRHQHIHAQAVARVHHGKSQTVAACDHFSSNNHQPAQ